MTTATVAELVKVDQETMVSDLKAARKHLEGVKGEVVVDFSSVEWLDSAMVRALEEFAETFEGGQVTVVLQGVSVGVYKVLKLVGLAARFSFAA